MYQLLKIEIKHKKLKYILTIITDDELKNIVILEPKQPGLYNTCIKYRFRNTISQNYTYNNQEDPVVLNKDNLVGVIYKYNSTNNFLGIYLIANHIDKKMEYISRAISDPRVLRRSYLNIRQLGGEQIIVNNHIYYKIILSDTEVTEDDEAKLFS